MWTLKQIHGTTFLVAPHRALTNALARFTTDKSVNKSCIYSQLNKLVQMYRYGVGGRGSFDPLITDCGPVQRSRFCHLDIIQSKTEYRLKSVKTPVLLSKCREFRITASWNRPQT